MDKHIELLYTDQVLANGTDSAFFTLPFPAEAQIEDMLGIALQECNRFYPAFQHVIWAGKSPRDALDSALFETAGEA